MDGNLAGTTGQSTQQSTILRLLQADTEAKARIQQAQETSRTLTTDGDAEIARLLDETRIEAEHAAQSLIEQARMQAQSDAQRIADDAAAGVEEMVRRAHLHLDEAIALVVAWVSGEES